MCQLCRNRWPFSFDGVRRGAIEPTDCGYQTTRIGKQRRKFLYLCDIVSSCPFLKALFLKGSHLWQIKRSPTMLMSNNAYVKSPSYGLPPCDLMDARIQYRSGFCGMARHFSYLANLAT